MGILKNVGSSDLGFKGETPAYRKGVDNTSQLHAQEINPTVLKAKHSNFDLDGLTPTKYQNPEADLDKAQ